MNKAVRTALIVASSWSCRGAADRRGLRAGVRPEDYKGDDISDIFHRLFGGTVTIGVGPAIIGIGKTNTAPEATIPCRPRDQKPEYSLDRRERGCRGLGRQGY
jgi:hypothetical protein